MLQTFTQIATQALRDIGCLRPGQTAGPDALNDCLYQVNNLIDVWLLDGLLVYSIRDDIYPLQAGLQEYHIGPAQTSPNFAAARPTQIQDANIILNTFSPVVRVPLEIINVDNWANIRVQQLPHAIPLQLYYDKSFNAPDGYSRLLLWPGPLTNYQLELFTWQQLTSFPDLVTPILMPPGYARLIQKSLAIEVAPSMQLNCKTYRLSEPQQPLLALVASAARDAMDKVTSYNAPNPMMACDSAYMSVEQRGAWNYGIGENRSRGG